MPFAPAQRSCQNNHVSGKCWRPARAMPGAVQMRTGETGIARRPAGTLRRAGGARTRVFPREQHRRLPPLHLPRARAASRGDCRHDRVAADGRRCGQVSGERRSSGGKPAFVRVRVRDRDGAGNRPVSFVSAMRTPTIPDYPGAWIGRVESVSGADVVLRVPAQQLVQRMDVPQSVAEGGRRDQVRNVYRGHQRHHRGPDADRQPVAMNRQTGLDTTISSTWPSARASAAVSHRLWMPRRRRPGLRRLPGRYLLTVSAKWRALTPPARIRVLALGGAVAVVVHRAMSLLGPRRAARRGPAVLVLVACVRDGALLAGPIAQAVERLRAVSGGRPIRVLALSPIPEEGAGCRFRIAQFIPYLESVGINVTLDSLFTPEFFRLVYKPGHYSAEGGDLCRAVAQAARFAARFVAIRSDSGLPGNVSRSVRRSSNGCSRRGAVRRSSSISTMRFSCRA